MSQLDWYKNEIELVEEFLGEASVILASVEAYDEKLTVLKANKQEIEGAEDSLYKTAKLKVMGQIIQSIEETIKENLKTLQAVKENYLAQELVDTLETLTAVEDTEQLSDDACNEITKINLLHRKYEMGWIA